MRGEGWGMGDEELGRHKKEQHILVARHAQNRGEMLQGSSPKWLW